MEFRGVDFRAVATEIRVAEIIGEDDEDVGLFLSGKGELDEEEEDEGGKVSHVFHYVSSTAV